MITLEQQPTKRLEVPLRIWVSLEGLRPQKDFVINTRSGRELVLDIREDSLQTITRINGISNINYHERVLIDYALHQMKPIRVVTFYERSYNPKTKAMYEHFNQMLTDAGA